MRIFILFISLITVECMAAEITTDDFLKDLNVVKEAYEKTNELSMYVKHSTYVGAKSQTAHETKSGYYKKKEKFLESTVLGIHKISDGELELSVNPLSHIAVLTEFKPQEPVDIEAIKAYMKTVSKIEKTADKGETKYRLNFDEGGELTYFEFVINAENFITSIEYLYSKTLSHTQADGKKLEGQPKVKINYTQIRIKGVEDISGRMNSYLDNNEGEYKLKGKYSQYEFYDNRLKR